MCRSHLAYSVPYFLLATSRNKARCKTRRLANHGKPTLLPHLHSNLHTYVLNRGSSSSCIHVGLLTTSLGAAKMPIVRSKLQMINNIRPSPPSTQGLYAQLERRRRRKATQLIKAFTPPGCLPNTFEITKGIRIITRPIAHNFCRLSCSVICDQ